VSRAFPRSLVALLTAAVGIAVANLYYAQPLAAAIALDLKVSVPDVSSALTLTQVGYGLGVILLAPLGDGRERRSTIAWTAASSVVALLLLACAPNMLVLGAASLLVGLTTSVVQMIIPYGVSLVDSEQRGRVVGGIMAGLLAGILLSRTLSGAIGAVLGWRAVYLIAAGGMAALAAALRLALPTQQPPERLRWRSILQSLASIFLAQPILRRRALVGALGMASFSVFWSMLSFQVGVLGYGSAVAGLFGVVGLVGVVVAPIAGRLAVGPAPERINWLGLAIAASSFLVFWLGARSLYAIGAGVVLLDAGVQASHLTNQTVIFGLAPALQSRLNALYMVSYFAGGALGTFTAAVAWSLYGWPAVCGLGAAYALAGMLPLSLGSVRGS
jgi:predicted MFS family arabinose efflux permease